MLRLTSFAGREVITPPAAVSMGDDGSLRKLYALLPPNVCALESANRKRKGKRKSILLKADITTR
jgi:hypothetical protein